MLIRIAVPEANVNEAVLNPALEAVTSLNEQLIRQGLSPTFHQALKAGTRWKPEPKDGFESFDNGTLVSQRSWGDCDDLAPLRAASMRATGEDPYASAIVYRSGPKRWHAVVQRGDGTIEDPSEMAGMRAAQAYVGQAAPLIAPMPRAEASVCGGDDLLGFDDAYGEYDDEGLWYPGGEYPGDDSAYDEPSYDDGGYDDGGGYDGGGGGGGADDGSAPAPPVARPDAPRPAPPTGGGRGAPPSPPTGQRGGAPGAPTGQTRGRPGVPASSYQGPIPVRPGTPTAHPGSPTPGGGLYAYYHRSPPARVHGVVRPVVALRPLYSTKSGSVVGWEARTDMPWEDTQRDLTVLRRAGLASQALVGSVLGACMLGQASGTADPRNLQRCMAIVGLLRGSDPYALADAVGPRAVIGAAQFLRDVAGTVAQHGSSGVGIDFGDVFHAIEPVLSRAAQFIPGVGPIASEALDITNAATTKHGPAPATMSCWCVDPKTGTVFARA